MGIVNNSLGSARRIRGEFIQAGLAVSALVAFSIGFGPKLELKHSSGTPEIRVAYMPNFTHAPAILGIDGGEFKTRLPQYEISAKVVNAGPEAMEALMAGAVDMAYVGPSPAVNTFVRSHGRALKIVAGVCEGGASLMAQPELDIRCVADLANHRVAVPELGGTQDVSLRHFLKQVALRPREAGGNVEIIPIKNPEILALFKQRQIDAAWVPEPWASRLALEAGARAVLQEKDLWPAHRFTSTVLVASSTFIAEHPDAVSALVEKNAELIRWMDAHPSEAKDRTSRAIAKLTGRPLDPAIVQGAWSHLTFSSGQDRASLRQFALAAQDAGYLAGGEASASGIWLDASILNRKILAVASSR